MVPEGVNPDVTVTDLYTLVLWFLFWRVVLM